MPENYKPGGGNKLQAYIPAGNGRESGEYTNKEGYNMQRKLIYNCYIRNIRFKYNFYKSKLVKKVNMTYISGKGASISATGTPNSVAKKVIGGYIVTERYYNNKGEAYLDIDYTCHGNLSKHPYVPHIHRWLKGNDGKLRRGNWEVFR